MSFALMLPTTSAAPPPSTVIRTIASSSDRTPSSEQTPTNEQYHSPPLDMRQMESNAVRRIVMGDMLMTESQQIEHLTSQLQGVDQKTLQAIPALLQHMTKGHSSDQPRPHDLSPPITGQLLQHLTKGMKSSWSSAARMGPNMTVCQIDGNNYPAQIVEQQLATANQLIERYQLQNQQSSEHILTSSPMLVPKNLQNISPKPYEQTLKPEENNSRRLRWKEEHGRALISIWKDKYPQVRSAKKIKEKHAVWQEIGAAYNLLCIRNDWPNRSTDQVKIKVKNCIDEYKQTIKYNQEYKTCPYFKDIDDIFGMSDPDKSLELAAAQQSSPQYNTDNAYWSGSSLPTQVKKRKLNISCGSLVDGSEQETKSEPVPVSTPILTNGHQRDVVLLMNSQSTPSTLSSSLTPSLTESNFTRICPKPIKREESNGGSRNQSPQLRVHCSPPITSPRTPQAEEFNGRSLSNQFSDIIRQIHDREDRLIEVYHRIDLERRESYLQRERERQAAELQMESSRQRFLGSIIEKLIDIIKDRKKQGGVEPVEPVLQVVDESKEVQGG